jgi:hypothetical protein
MLSPGPGGDIKILRDLGHIREESACGGHLRSEGNFDAFEDLRLGESEIQ